MVKKTDYLEIINKMRSFRRILLCTHLAPDADALGSMLAMASLIRGMGISVQACCQDAVPADLRFLPGADTIVSPDTLGDEAFDLAVSVDASDVERLGTAGPAFLRAPFSIQVDHHRTNTRFAQINLVVDTQPATGCIVYNIFEAAGLQPGREDAICLYAAISTDTGNFCFSNISDETFTQMAGLMRSGLPIVEIARLLHLMKEKEHLLLLGRALRSLTFHEGGQLTSMLLRKEDFHACGASGEHADKIVNYALYVPGVKMCYLASETQEGIKFSLRAIAPNEVATIAASLGGGGHAQASGCTLHLPLPQALASVHAKMSAALTT